MLVALLAGIVLVFCGFAIGCAFGHGPEPSTPSRAAPGMTIATWNVACFEKAKPKEIATTFAELGVDVLALQEDLEFTEEEKENALKIPGYSKVVACRGEELWNNEDYKNPQWEHGARNLQNVIHVRDDRVEVVKSGSLARISDDSRAAKAPRCAVWADLRLKGGDTEIRLANVHLSGGRFTDEQFITFTGEKEHEIGAVLSLAPQPDILVGDFNSYASEEQVHANQAKYRPYQAAKEKEPAQFQQYVNWSREGVLSSERRGYTRIQADCQTSKYGGTVDHMYFSNKKVSGDFAWCGGNTYQQSDHNMVVSVVRKAHGSGTASG